MGEGGPSTDMLKVLDPEAKYFSSGVIKCRESTCVEENWSKDVAKFGVPLE